MTKQFFWYLQPCGLFIINMYNRVITIFQYKFHLNKLDKTLLSGGHTMTKQFFRYLQPFVVCLLSKVCPQGKKKLESASY